jgi:hypothetical protein
MNRLENISHCCNSIVSVGTCLFAKPLLSNGSCIFAYLAVVAQQRICVLQYIFQTQIIIDQYSEALKEQSYPCA